MTYSSYTKPENAHQGLALQVMIIYEEITMWRYSFQPFYQNTDKYVACPQYTGSASPTMVWDFFAILLRKRFEGLGSLGSGRCGALALAGNCCQTKDEVLSSTSTPSSAISMYYNLTYISALVGCWTKAEVMPSASTLSVSWYLMYILHKYFPVYQWLGGLHQEH